ncbi:LysR family transcriptional regulator [Nesterenkonia ebinurensis]|uniref:LysR family transcriptional regulator n=1 Tax=Nesterenkonia ebinurensis TaxID=2608252 RepID=UPI00123D0DB7|nr:LysR family transcriptional regulator [Nesterenkonia ebinurensis]
MTFLTVARLGRFTAAGEALGVNHSTVSRRISALEKALGDRVLTRTPSGWEVTKLGQRVVAVAEQVEEALSDLMVDDSNNAADRISGLVRIGAPDAFGVHIAPPALAALQRKHPGLEVELISATQPVRQGRSGLDLEIVIGRPQVRRARVEHVMDYSLFLYATEQYLTKYGMPKNINDLEGHRLNYYVDSVLTIDELGRARDAFPPMKHGIYSTNVLSHVTATLAGAGIGLLPNFLGDSNPSLHKILGREYKYNVSYWAVAREESLRSPVVQAVYSSLRDYGTRVNKNSSL